MILSRPYEDEDEAVESIREFCDWAKRLFGAGANDAGDECYDDDD